MKQWFPWFAEIEAPISVHVIWMHLYFYGFSDEKIRVAGFCGQEFGFLQSDSVVLIDAEFSYCRIVRLEISALLRLFFTCLCRCMSVHTQIYVQTK